MESDWLDHLQSGTLVFCYLHSKWGLISDSPQREGFSELSALIKIPFTEESQPCNQRMHSRQKKEVKVLQWQGTNIYEARVYEWKEMVVVVVLVNSMCPTLPVPWTVARQAFLLSMILSKNTVVGCHFFSGSSIRDRAWSLHSQADDLPTELN